MLSRWVRTWDYRVLRPFLLFLAKLGITANEVTLASLFIVIVAGVMLALGQLVLGGCLLLVGACLDGIDGELARVLNSETRVGAFLDSISDHAGDFALYLGLLWLFLSRDSHGEIILVFLALFGSMFGSQVRSRAAMLGIDTKTTGLFTRFERMAVLVAGLFTNQFFIALGILAIMNNFSALQRVVSVVQANRESGGKARP